MNGEQSARAFNSDLKKINESGLDEKKQGVAARTLAMLTYLKILSEDEGIKIEDITLEMIIKDTRKTWQ